MTAKLIVGYKTRLVDGAEPPEFICTDGRLKNPDLIQANIDKQADSWQDEAADQPYTGTFDEVFIADLNNERTQAWRYRGREPDSGKSPISVSVALWILDKYPEAWTDSIGYNGPPEVVFVGFGMQKFLKILGLECSLPREGYQRLPVSMWYGNGEHRDVENAVKPTTYKFLDWNTVISTRRPVGEEDAVKYDEIMKGWEGPGQDPEVDSLVSMEFCSQLGFLSDQ